MTSVPRPTLATLPLALALAGGLLLHGGARGQTAGMELQGPTPPAPPSASHAPLPAPEPRVSGVAAGGPVVEVKQLRIEGNASLSTERLLAAVGTLTGRRMSLAELNALAEQITLTYRQNGFALARAYLPAQTVTDGVVSITVVEGLVSAVTARGSDPKTAGAQPFLDAGIPVGAPVRADTLERTMLLLDDQPGFSVRPTLRPGRDFGQTELQVDVTRRNRVSGEVGIDNTGNAATGRQRARASVNVNSPWRFGDRLALTALVTDERLWLGSADYETPLDAQGLRGGVSVSRSSYQLDGAFAALGAQGLADTLGLRVSRSLVRSQRANLLLTVGGAHKRLVQQFETLGVERRRTSDSVTAALQFDRRDDAAGGGVLFGQASVTAGRLRMDEESRAIDDLTARTRGAFHRLNIDLARIQRVGGIFSSYARLSAQWTNANLDASEKFGLGGFLGVRAYPMGEGSGDRGVVGQIELRASLPAAITAFTWADAGRVRLNAEPWDDASGGRRSLAGAGLGGRWSAGPWSAETTLGWRVKGGRPEAESADRNPRWFLSAAYRFD